MKVNQVEFDTYGGNERAKESDHQDDISATLKAQIQKQTLSFFGVQDEYYSEGCPLTQMIENRKKIQAEKWLKAREALEVEVDRLARSWKTGKYAEK